MLALEAKQKAGSSLLFLEASDILAGFLTLNTIS
jgi:hypothetical protein